MKYKIFKQSNLDLETNEVFDFIIKKKRFFIWSKNVFNNKGLPRTCFCKTLKEAEQLIKILN